jgi:hypothetical protein
MWIALRSALCAIPWADLTREEKLAASEASIQQFLAAYMAMIPAYLDWLTEEYGDSMNYYCRKPPETKSGRVISAATKQKLSTARDHVKSADDLLIALLDSEADDTDDGEDTSEGKAAIEPAPEPAGPDHSAAQTLIEQIRSSIPAA